MYLIARPIDRIALPDSLNFQVIGCTCDTTYICIVSMHVGVGGAEGGGRCRHSSLVPFGTVRNKHDI